MLSKVYGIFENFESGQTARILYGKSKDTFLARKRPLGFPQLTVVGGSGVQLPRDHQAWREAPGSQDIKQKYKG